MAAFSMTVSNILNCLGSPTDNWAAFNWNAFKWGAGTADFETRIIKYLTTDPIVFDSTMGVGFILTINNSLSPDSDIASDTLQTSNGYFYVFKGGTTNSSSSYLPSFSTDLTTYTSWSTHTAATAAWS